MEKTRVKPAVLILLAGLVFSPPVFAEAQENTADEQDILNPTGEVVGAPEGPYDVLDDQPAGLTDELCQYMIYYVPPADVAYKEGVDAYGNPVTPADDPDTIRIDDPEAAFPVNLTLDLADRLGVDLSDGVTAEALIGTIVVDHHGRMYFNGQSLQPDALDVMLEDCGQGMINFQ